MGRLPGDICARCLTRQGTEIWTEGTMAYIHGAYQMYCKVCVLTCQIQHAKERAAAIPEMERELEELKKVVDG
jgi:hypothetical protein